MANDLAVLATRPASVVSPRSRVVKSNALARAAYAASLEVTRILAYSFAALCERADATNALPPDEDVIVEVPVRELSQIFVSMAKSKTLYERVKDKRKELTGFAIDVEDEEQKTWNRWVLVTDASYRNGVLTLTFNKRMREHIGELKRNFLAYQMMHVLELENGTQHHLYEMLKSYLYQGRWRVEYDDLRKRLKLDGVARYAAVGNFKKDVLTPFIERANKTTDMLITVDDIKDGRKIVGFMFLMSEKQKHVVSEFSEEQKRVLARLKELGVHHIAAQKVVLGFDVVYIEEKIEAALAQKRAGKIKRNFAGWLMSAINEDFDALSAEQKADIEKRRRMEACISAFEKASKRTQDQMTAAFRTTLMQGSPGLLAAFDSSGLDEPVVRRTFAGFVRTKAKDYGIALPA